MTPRPRILEICALLGCSAWVTGCVASRAGARSDGKMAGNWWPGWFPEMGNPHSWMVFMENPYLEDSGSGWWLGLPLGLRNPWFSACHDYGRTLNLMLCSPLQEACVGNFEGRSTLHQDLEYCSISKLSMILISSLTYIYIYISISKGYRWTVMISPADFLRCWRCWLQTQTRPADRLHSSGKIRKLRRHGRLGRWVLDSRLRHSHCGHSSGEGSKAYITWLWNEHPASSSYLDLLRVLRY